MEKSLTEKLFNDTMLTVNDLSLLLLNDECLINVCAYLDIFDLINVAGTCIRLQGIAYSQYNKIKSFEWNQFEHLPMNADIKEVISLIGTQIIYLTFNGSYERLSARDYCGAIREKCLHVKTLKLIGCHNYTSIIGEANLLPWLRTYAWRIYVCFGQKWTNPFGK